MSQFETVRPTFTTSTLRSRWIIYRSQFDRERFYFTVVNGELLRLPSVTTIIEATLPTEEWLIRWIARLGYEKAIEKRNEASHYGTLFSITISDFFRSGEIDLGSIEARVRTYITENRLDVSASRWEQKLKEDLYSLNAFVAEYGFEPLAVELPLVSVEHRFAGTIDAVGYMNIGTGVNGKILKRDKETRRVLAILDWKSGRHGFYRSHEAQLQMYHILFRENFPEISEEIKLYNWAPKDWEEEEDQKFTIKDQTESIERDRVLHYIHIYRLGEKEKNFRAKVFDGVLQLGQKNGNLKIVDYSEIMKEKIGGEL